MFTDALEWISELLGVLMDELDELLLIADCTNASLYCGGGGIPAVRLLRLFPV